MKKIKYTYYLTCLLLLSLLVGCSKDFLERPPLSSIVDANFYQSNEELLSGTAGLYNTIWFEWNDNASHGIGDARGGVLFSGYSYQLDNVKMITSGNTGENAASWRGFYNTIGQCNTVISNINKYAGPSVTADRKLYALGEARFMRGIAYSYLVQNYGAIPIIEDNQTLLKDTTKSRNTVESVWQFIIRDLRFASEALSSTPLQTGRVSKWSAEGMLAKMYLTRAGVGMNGARRQSDLDSAAYFAKRVIDNSGKMLMPNYEDLFKIANNNNIETLFALQWQFDGPYSTQNRVQGFLASNTAAQNITGFGDGWGGDIGATKFILDQYEDFAQDKRRKATYMFPGDQYEYIHAEIDDPDKAGAKKIVPLQVWTDNNNLGASRGRASMKKYVVGRPQDNNGRVLTAATSMQTYILRLADVYLVYAEAILGNNATLTDLTALDYYNKVRVRAGLDPKESATWEDIHKERLLEFAMEGQAWYEFTRLHYYKPTLAYSKLSSQDRGFYTITPNNKANPTAWEVKTEGTGIRTYEVSANNFIIPIPTVELALAPNLRKPPVPYQFN